MEIAFRYSDHRESKCKSIIPSTILVSWHKEKASSKKLYYPDRYCVRVMDIVSE